MKEVLFAGELLRASDAGGVGGADEGGLRCKYEWSLVLVNALNSSVDKPRLLKRGVGGKSHRFRRITHSKLLLVGYTSNLS